MFLDVVGRSSVSVAKILFLVLSEFCNKAVKFFRRARIFLHILVVPHIRNFRHDVIFSQAPELI